MARHKLTKEEQIRGLKKLVASPKVNAGMKAWARKRIKTLGG